MALGLGGFIAAMLGSAAVGAASGTMQRKLREEAEAKAFKNKILQTALMQAVNDGVPITEAMFKESGLPKEVFPIVSMMSEQKRTAKAQGMAMFQQIAGGMGVPGMPTPDAPTQAPPPSASQAIPSLAGAAPAVAPQGPPQVQPPGEALPLPHQMTPALAEQQQGRPLSPSPTQVAPMPAVPPPQAGGTMQQVPPQAQTAPMPQVPATSAPAPAPVTSTASALRRFGAQLRPGTGSAKMTATIDLGGGLKASAERVVQSDDLRAQAFMAYATRLKAKPNELVQEALAAGIPLKREDITTYSELWQSQNYGNYLATQTQGRTPNPSDHDHAMLSMWLDGGGPMSPQMQQRMFGSQQDVDQSYLTSVIKVPPHLLGQFEQLWPIFSGASPSQETLQRVREQAKASVRSRLVEQNPGLAQNEAALQDAVNRALGFVGVTEQEIARAGEKAPLSPAAQEQATIAGQPVPLARQLGQAPLAGQAPAAPVPAAELQRRAQEAEAQQAATTRESTEAGAARGRETAKGIEVISDPTALEKYIDPQTGNTPEPMTQKELDAKIKRGELGTLNVARNIYNDFKVIKSQVGLYEPIVERKGGVFDISATRRAALRVAAQPLEVEIAGFKLLPDVAVFMPIARRLGFSETQISDMVAMLNFNRLAVAHLRALGEKGQGVSARLFEQGARAFPTPWDTRETARAKIKAWHDTVDIRLENAVSIVGKGQQQRVRRYNPATGRIE